MKTIKNYGLVLVTILILVASLVACGPTAANGTAPVTLDEQQVNTILQNMLTAYNSGDYSAFAKNLSPQLKLVINEGMFQKFLTQSEATLGKFKSIQSIEPSTSDSGNTAWTVTAEFEKSTQQFTVTFDKSTGMIEGMDFGQVP